MLTFKHPGHQFWLTTSIRDRDRRVGGKEDKEDKEDKEGKEDKEDKEDKDKNKGEQWGL